MGAQDFCVVVLKFTEAFASFEDKWGPVAGFKLDNDAYGFCGSASS